MARRATIRLTWSVPKYVGRPELTKAQIAQVLRKSMTKAAEGYPLPKGWRVDIHWKNGPRGKWKRGPWSQEMTDSLNGRSGSIGWHHMIDAWIEENMH